MSMTLSTAPWEWFDNANLFRSRTRLSYNLKCICQPGGNGCGWEARRAIWFGFSGVHEPSTRRGGYSYMAYFYWWLVTRIYAPRNDVLCTSFYERQLEVYNLADTTESAIELINARQCLYERLCDSKHPELLESKSCRLQTHVEIAVHLRRFTRTSDEEGRAEPSLDMEWPPTGIDRNTGEYYPAHPGAATSATDGTGSLVARFWANDVKDEGIAGKLVRRWKLEGDFDVPHCVSTAPPPSPQWRDRLIPGGGHFDPGGGGGTMDEPPRPSADGLAAPGNLAVHRFADPVTSEGPRQFRAEQALEPVAPWRPNLPHVSPLPSHPNDSPASDLGGMPSGDHVECDLGGEP